jgi:predicted dehydrogenase
MNVGIIGCGNICGIYFKDLAKLSTTRVAACADIVDARAQAKAEECGCRAMTVEDLLADGEIDIVVNLTVPRAHAPIAKAALKAGKHVYNEKPLTLQRDEAKEMLAIAREGNLRVGCAPDTFLGAGIQTCRALIDAGEIGRPVACTAFMLCRGHETWHPDPEFYYKPGGGPMFDMGPYYLTALVNLVGPIRRVTGSARISMEKRTILSQPKQGQVIDVEVPTHIAGVMDFADGAVGTIITSFDVHGFNLPRIEIHGTEGSISVPDPNSFGGPVRLIKLGGDWQDVPVDRPYAENSRGLGVADMAAAIASGRAHRVSGELAYHVLDAMHAFHDASEQGRHVELDSGVDRPEPLPADLVEGDVPA